MTKTTRVNIKNIFPITTAIMLFVIQSLSIYASALDNSLSNWYELHLIDLSSHTRRFNLTYDIVVYGDEYVNSRMKIQDPHYNKVLELVYRASLYMVREPNIEIGTNYAVLLLNQTPVCMILTNDTIQMNINFVDDRVKILLALNKAYLICNVKPWFHYKGNTSLGIARYLNRNYSLYIGFANNIVIQREFRIDPNKWALFRNNTYVGDMIFLIDKDELKLNATILLLRHSSTITCTINNTMYPSSVLVYVDYTKHPTTGFKYGAIRVDRINIGLGDHFRPTLNNIKMVNPPVELVRHWMKIAQKYSLMLINYGNNTYAVLNANFSRTYDIISGSRYWSLKYAPSSIIKSSEMKFYRFKPFVYIDNISYCVVPFEYNLSISYNTLNGVLLEMNFSRSIPIPTNRTILIPPDILLHGLGIEIITYPYKAKLSIRLSRASFSLQENVELGGHAYIDVNTLSTITPMVMVLSLIMVVIVALLLSLARKRR